MFVPLGGVEFSWRPMSSIVNFTAITIFSPAHHKQRHVKLRHSKPTGKVIGNVSSKGLMDQLWILSLMVGQRCSVASENDICDIVWYSAISCSPRWSPQICILSSQLLDVLGLAKHKMNPIMSKKNDSSLLFILYPFVSHIPDIPSITMETVVQMIPQAKATFVAGAAHTEGQSWATIGSPNQWLAKPKLVVHPCSWTNC